MGSFDEEKREVVDSYLKEKERKERSSNKKSFLLLIISIILFRVVLLHGAIPSASMEPTVSEGDYIIGNKLYYKFNEPKHGDIVIFKKDKIYMIKRVIGLPGDNISFKNGEVYRNDKRIEEDYLNLSKSTFPADKTNGRDEYDVPDGYMFLLGDNRYNSLDSRYFDEVFISMDDVVAKYIFKYNFDFLKR